MKSRSSQLYRFVLALVAVLGSDSLGFAQDLGPAPWLDPARPELWQPAIQPFGVEVYTPLDTSNRVQVRNAYQQYATPMPSMQWTGSVATCDPGSISTAFREWTISRVNFHRAMAGLPGNITLNEVNSAKAQQAALMFSANMQLSHSPPSGWLCYTADGAQAAGSSNIALAFGSSTFDDVVPRYMDDAGTNNQAAGHRRWILYPPQTNMAVGSTPTSPGQWGGNALWVLSGFGTRPPTPEGTPWPPRGFVPLPLFPASKRWSFSYPGANFASASVVMTVDGAPVPLTVVSRTDNGFGDNTIVWEPTGTVAKGVLYTIFVTSVTGAGIPSGFAYTVRPFDPADPIPVRGDFDRDGRSGVLWRHTSGTNYLWNVNGASINGGVLSIASQGLLPGVPGPDWAIVGIGDFNGDGKSDILWRHADGTNYVWHVNGASIVGGVVQIGSQGLLPGVADPGWSVVGTGDFNGDGKADILWRHTNGTNYVWHLDGSTINGGVLTISTQGLLPTVDTSWSVAGVGDYNGDGKADILWRKNDGTNYVWHVNGATITGGVLSISSQGLLPGVDASWSVVGVGDYNGDGKADVLWRRSDGTNYVWHVNGAVITGGVLSTATQGLLPSVTDTSWSVVGAGDYNGDGKADVLWRHTNGTNYVWHVDGATINGGVLSIPTQGLLPGVADPGWQVQNPK